MRIPFLSQIHNDLKMDTRHDTVPLSKYPRPSLKRDSFLCLNGEWDIKRKLEDTKPFDRILVPYPAGSKLSGLKKDPGKKYVYERKFTLPEGFIKDRVLLNIGAVDAEALVYVNGKLLGSHEGGYVSFTVDITDGIDKTPGYINTLSIAVTDELDHKYPYGKQKKHRGGMWYTPVSGIWKSVWLESVSDDHIKAIEITPSLDAIDLNIASEANDYEIEIYDGGHLVTSLSTYYDTVRIDIPEPKLWTPEDPHLYDIKVKTPNDEVTSYFGLRTVSVKEINGIKRILLNEKPYYFHGVLDQGYFPEGIYTPNTEEDYEADILRLKALGINTIRKHIKIEPEAFYEACDRLGMLVFQDMVNNGSYKYIRHTVLPTLGYQKLDDTKVKVKDVTKNNFALSMEDTLVSLYNFPSVVYYTIFNEGWGQFESDMLYGWAKTMDRTRIIDSTSGWFWQEKSDVDSLHIYFKDVNIKRSDRPVILSEFGGISLKVKENSYSRYTNYGYGKCRTKEDLTNAFVKLYEEQVIPGIKNGLCGSIYTQAFDVEDETNGLYTYDRKVCKVIEKEMKDLSEKLRIDDEA